MKVQVSQSHYNFDGYVNNERWNSYYYQVNEVLKCKWSSVLIIWVWDWIVADILKGFWKEVTTFDFDKSLNPDILWDVTKIDEIINRKFDIVVCCQVLEHIPFDMFEKIIEKIKNITKERFILSLPNRNVWFKFQFKAPLIGKRWFKFHFRLFWTNHFEINKEWIWEHYREIDAKKEWKFKKIKNIINEFYKIDNIYIPYENTYHVFFILWKK